MKLGGFRGMMVCALLLGVNVAAQQTGGTTGGGTTGGGTTGGGTTGGGTTGGGTPGGTTPGGNTGNTGRGTQPSQQPSMQLPPRPIFIAGQVLLSDGTAPPSQVVIERVCQMRTYREGYTDSRGFFSIQLGQSQGVFADASTNTGFGDLGFGGATMNGGPSTQELSSCEIRASLPGYRSDSLPLFNIQSMQRNDVGIIVLHYFGNVQGLTTSATTALAPKDAKKAFEKGTKALDKNNPDEAQKELLKAVALHPRFAEAWFHLGRVYERREHKDEAREAYKKAIGADGNLVPPYERMYLMAYSENKWDEVLEHTDKVLRLNPYDFPGAYYVNAVANYQLKKFDAAEKSARESAKLKGKQAEPRSQYVLGLTLAQKGEFAAASESLTAFLKSAPLGTNVEQVQKVLTDVNRLAAETKR